MVAPPTSDLVAKLIAASELIYERTDRTNAYWLLVAEDSTLYQAIVRGEFREFGIDPEKGYPIEGGMIRFDKPGVSAVDQLADLGRL